MFCMSRLLGSPKIKWARVHLICRLWTVHGPVPKDSDAVFNTRI